MDTKKYVPDLTLMIVTSSYHDLYVGPCSMVMEKIALVVIMENILTFVADLSWQNMILDLNMNLRILSWILMK